MMKIVPKFKSDTGVQKVNTIFLTDGESSGLKGVYDYCLVTTGPDKGNYNKTKKKFPWNRFGKKDVVITDLNNKTYEINSSSMTNELLSILKNQVGNQNVVGFFIAGSGRTGRVDKRSLYSLCPGDSNDAIMEKVKFINKNKYLAITQCGYDEYYVLPGGNNLCVESVGLSDDLIGASKAKLKTAFGKSMKGKIVSRPLLNKFIKLVT
jgi:hypothetical protein